MFPEVRVEMARKKLTALDLSNKTGIRYQTLTAKLRGESELTFNEAVTIKAGLETDLPLEVLFKKEGA